jgi:hypothetical protein
LHVTCQVEQLGVVVQQVLPAGVMGRHQRYMQSRTSASLSVWLNNPSVVDHAMETRHVVTTEGAPAYNHSHRSLPEGAQSNQGLLV